MATISPCILELISILVAGLSILLFETVRPIMIDCLGARILKPVTCCFVTDRLRQLVTRLMPRFIVVLGTAEMDCLLVDPNERLNDESNLREEDRAHGRW